MHESYQIDKNNGLENMLRRVPYILGREKQGHKVVRVFFFENQKNRLGSGGKIRVGRVTRNIHIFSLALTGKTVYVVYFKLSKYLNKNAKAFLKYSVIQA